ncbi:C40 family peptidase [Corynebacterium kroppenstedtii]|uniref:C40 family peptidase n=1 Tax=Corynebacterium sp. PCR 32 TaxID=3351342 RepID=UPI00309563D2
MAKHSRKSASTGRKIAAASAVGLGATTAIVCAGNATATEVHVPNTQYTVPVPDQLQQAQDVLNQKIHDYMAQAHIPPVEAVAAINSGEPAPAPVATPAPAVAPTPAPSVADIIQSIGQKIAEAAQSKLGSPYAWGGTGPAAFDCSGLVKWAYEQAGIAIPRTSDSQLAGGTPVSLDALQPGDIVGFYGGNHVGVYVGDGKVVHAPQEGQTVSVIPMAYMETYSATRYS